MKSRRRILVAALAAVAAAGITGYVTEFRPASRSTLAMLPRSSSATSPPSGYYRTMAAEGSATLVADGVFGYWCDGSSCRYSPPLERWSLGHWSGGQPLEVAAGVLPGGLPVFAALTQLGGTRLRLSLGSCTRQACRTVGGGVFSAPGWRPSNLGPAGLITHVYAASASGNGTRFAVVFGDDHAGNSSTLYVAGCDSARCAHPAAIRLGTTPFVDVYPGHSPVAVDTTPQGGLAVAVQDYSPTSDGPISVYECARLPCASVTRHEIPVPDTGNVALAVTPGGETLLAYETWNRYGGASQGVPTHVVVLGCDSCASPGASFRTIGTLPVLNPDVEGFPVPAIAVSSRYAMAVQSDKTGRQVLLTSCALTSCGTSTATVTLAKTAIPLGFLGLSIAGPSPRVLWATHPAHANYSQWQYMLYTCATPRCAIP
jgi:hypothetical protein